MRTEKTWVIDTADLQVGTTLSFDLMDSDGNVLHKANTPITDRLLERLVKKNIHSVNVQGQYDAESVSPVDVLLSSFPEESIREIQDTISEAEQVLDGIYSHLQSQTAIDYEAINKTVARFAKQAAEDSSATLAVLFARCSSMPSGQRERLIARTSAFALLGIATSVVMELDEEQIRVIGIAGFLHDCSLSLHPEWFDENRGVFANSKRLSEYRNHPMESVELLKDSEGIDEQVLQTMAQVHEQFDGSGFPLGLNARDIALSASILNLADAYLNLVQPLFKNECVLCSDAIAYICHHAAYRRFDPRVVRGLIKAISMYPIGCAVELDDESTAVVIRTNPDNPLEPTVQILGATKRVADLSVSPRSIVGTKTPHLENVTRITKSMMDDLLWRSDVELAPTY
jgi:HD-GYP domain-containing protein (c-di-GMP phosphodiesterase class II)